MIGSLVLGKSILEQHTHNTTSSTSPGFIRFSRNQLSFSSATSLTYGNIGESHETITTLPSGTGAAQKDNGRHGTVPSRHRPQTTERDHDSGVAVGVVCAFTDHCVLPEYVPGLH